MNLDSSGARAAAKCERDAATGLRLAITERNAGARPAAASRGASPLRTNDAVRRAAIVTRSDAVRVCCGRVGESWRRGECGGEWDVGLGRVPRGSPKLVT